MSARKNINGDTDVQSPESVQGVFLDSFGLLAERLWWRWKQRQRHAANSSQPNRPRLDFGLRKHRRFCPYGSSHGDHRERRVRIVLLLEDFHDQRACFD